MKFVKIASNRRHVRLVALGGALVWLGLALAFAARAGFVTDEGQHLAAGLAMASAGDFRMNPEHPPLVKALAALPVMLLAPPDFHPAPDTAQARALDFAWRRSDPWMFLYATVFLDDGAPWPRRLLLARLAPILIGLLGGALAFAWGRALSRRAAGGLLAAALLLFYSEYLGHACFVTFDVPLLVSCAAINWMAWQWWRRPDWRRGAVFAVLAVAAAQVKLPATFFLAFLLAILILLAFFSRGRVRPRRAAALALLVAALWWAGAWAAAGFRFAGTNSAIPAEGGIRFMPPVPGENLGAIPRACNVLWAHRLLPEPAISQIIHLGTFENRAAYLAGETRMRGWLHYFFVTFLLKTPWPLLLAGPLLAWRGWRLWRARGRLTRGWRLQRAAILGGPFALLALLIIVSRVNIGHRHILFIYFPLCAGLGAELARWWRRGGTESIQKMVAGIPAWRMAVVALLGGHALSLALAWPHPSTYFNALAGGSPWRASRWLGDSNTDWGQDDAGLSDRLDALGWNAANLCLYVTHYPPEFYGLNNYRWFNPLKPPPFTHKRHDALDPALPTVISVNEVRSARAAFPGRFDREPDLAWNSQVVFLPGGPAPRL